MSSISAKALHERAQLWRNRAHSSPGSLSQNEWQQLCFDNASVLTGLAEQVEKPAAPPAPAVEKPVAPPPPAVEKSEKPPAATGKATK
jgi:hypothetical protein